MFVYRIKDQLNVKDRLRYIKAQKILYLPTQDMLAFHHRMQHERKRRYGPFVVGSGSSRPRHRAHRQHLRQLAGRDSIQLFNHRPPGREKSDTVTASHIR